MEIVSHCALALQWGQTKFHPKYAILLNIEPKIIENLLNT
jgi:hypothetical protein